MMVSLRRARNISRREFLAWLGAALALPAGFAAARLTEHGPGRVAGSDEAAEALRGRLRIPASDPTPADVSFGMFDGGPGIAALIQRHVDLHLFYKNWNNGAAAIPILGADAIAQVGAADCMWTIQPSSGPFGAAPADCVNWPELISGRYDDQIVTFANWIDESWGRPLYVRFAHEPNGIDWYDWQIGGSCGVTSAAQWAEGFDHFATVVKANSRWARLVWSVNCGPYDNIAGFYAPSCDVMGFDGYNSLVANWQTDSEIFAPAYRVVAALDPDKPIWICETACMEPDAPWTYEGVTYPAEPAYSKADWITTFMNNTGYPRLELVTWFNVQKERNWSVNSSVGAVDAFVDAFARSRAGVPLSFTPAPVTAPPTTAHPTTVAPARPVVKPAISGLSAVAASAGSKVIIRGSGFGRTRGTGYVRLLDGGTGWGAPGDAAVFHLLKWSDTAISFLVPTPSGHGSWRVEPGDHVRVSVVTAAGPSRSVDLLIIAGPPGTVRKRS
jgi:mannan endo-1,4-beta-mannosidase